VLHQLPAHNVAVLTGRHFFPTLIGGAFHHGLVIVFTAAACMSLAGALVSLLRGRQFYYEDQPGPPPPPVPAHSPAPSQLHNGTAPGNRPAAGDRARAAGASGAD